jgi:hypothetical protein
MTISLRNLPKGRFLRQAIARECPNEAVLRLLEAQLRKPAKNSDFEEFFGTWSRAEADAFDTALAAMRRINLADWESGD